MSRPVLWPYFAACLALALPLGDAAWGLSQLDPNFSWPVFSRGGFVLIAGLGGLALGVAQAGFWRLALGFELAQGARIAAWSALPWALGALWRPVLGVRLPPPHDLSYRNLQILLAAGILCSLWASLSLALIALHRSGRLRTWRPRSAALRLGGVAFLFFQLHGLWIGQWNMTGDAPHYLLLTQSIAYDGDLDLTNDYKGRDWKRFYDYAWDLVPQTAAMADGRDLTEHKAGLPMLLAPLYRLLGDYGALWVMALIAAAASALFFALCVDLGFSHRLALTGWALFSFSAPWMSQSQNLMAESIGGLGLLVSLCSFRKILPATTGWVSTVFASFIHIRYTVLALGISAVEAAQRWLARRPRAWVPVFWALLGLALSMGINRLLFGSANLMANREQRFSELIQPLQFFRHVGGLLLDQEFGFLPFAAIFALAPLGLNALWHRDRLWFWQTVLPFASYFGLIGCFAWWHGDMAPARFLTCLVPVMALWVLEAWRAWGERPVFWALALYSWAWGLGMSILPWLNYSKFNGQNWALRILGSWLKSDLTIYFPSFILGTPISTAWALALPIVLWAYWKRLGPPQA